MKNSHTCTPSSLISEDEMAKILNVSTRWLIQDRYLGRNQAPPFVKIGSMIRYSLEEYEKWLSNQFERGVSNGKD